MLNIQWKKVEIVCERRNVLNNIFSRAMLEKLGLNKVTDRSYSIKNMSYYKWI